MLTSTYVLATFSVEQVAIRKALFACQEHVQSSLLAIARLEQAALSATLDRLDQWHQRSRVRKLDLFLVPALRQATRQADGLLAELDGLSTLGLRMLGALRDCAKKILEGTAVCAEQICTSLLGYCSRQMTRLDREEGELMTLARKVIPRATWFALARQILLNQGAVATHARPAPAGPPRSTSAASPGARHGGARVPMPAIFQPGPALPLAASEARLRLPEAALAG